MGTGSYSILLKDQLFIRLINLLCNDCCVVFPLTVKHVMPVSAQTVAHCLDRGISIITPSHLPLFCFPILKLFFHRVYVRSQSLFLERKKKKDNLCIITFKPCIITVWELYLLDWVIKVPSRFLCTWKKMPKRSNWPCSIHGFIKNRILLKQTKTVWGF